MDEPLVGIIDVGACNLSSVRNAIYEQGYDWKSVSNPDDFGDITHLILPGVGHFAELMQRLHRQHLPDAIRAFVDNGHPTLAICLGMQLLADHSEEGNVDGLGIIPGQVRKLNVDPLRTPHIGWNEVKFVSSHPVLKEIKEKRDFYFVHSYHFSVEQPLNCLATTPYGFDFCSMVHQKNIVGAQFHPEKSQKNGLKLIENFCDWDGLNA